MCKARRRALASLLGIPVISVATAVLAGPASAATTGPPIYSRVEAGYAATGTTFHGVKANFPLPDPTTSASELTRVGFGVELWRGSVIMELGAWASTSSSAYHVTAWVWDRTTKTLICSTSSTTRPCPGTPPGWATRTFSYNTLLMLSVYFHRTYGTIRFNIYNWTTGANYDYYYTKAGTRTYGQARVVAELGCSPWKPCGGASQVPYKPPASVTRLVQAQDCEVYPDYSARSGFDGAFTRNKVLMTSDGTSTGTLEVAPADLTQGTADYPDGQFNVDLLP